MSGYNQEKGFTVVAETRRTWTDAEKKVILAETAERSVASVARKHGVASGLVFRWRREVGMAGKRKAAREMPEAFLPVVVPSLSPGAALASAPGIARGVIEIELAGGHKLRVSGPVDANTLKQVIAVLEG